MILITAWLRKRRIARKAEEFKRACALINSMGFDICEFKVVAGTTYIVSHKFGWHKIGSRK